MYQGNVVGPWVQARNGIGAGSSTALAEFKLFMASFFIRLQQGNRLFRISVHVDDICLAGSGRNSFFSPLGSSAPQPRQNL